MRKYTEIERANINFFGNMVNISMQIEELESYLDEIHKYIEITNYHLKHGSIKGYDTETLDNLKYHYEHTHGDTLRKSIIISIVIILESELDNYCQDFQKHRKLKVSYRDFKGDMLERFKYYSQKILDSTYNFGAKDWQDIIGLVEVRNCLIHNRGLLENFAKKKTIEQFVKRHSSFYITDNEFIEITQKGCADSLKIVNNFFEDITGFALTFFPGNYGQK